VQAFPRDRSQRLFFVADFWGVCLDDPLTSFNNYAFVAESPDYNTHSLICLLFQTNLRNSLPWSATSSVVPTSRLLALWDWTSSTVLIDIRFHPLLGCVHTSQSCTPHPPGLPAGYQVGSKVSCSLTSVVLQNSNTRISINLPLDIRSIGCAGSY
jgi:hypothetical protein